MNVPVRPTPAEQPTRIGGGLAESAANEALRFSVSCMKDTRWFGSFGTPVLVSPGRAQDQRNL